MEGTTVAMKTKRPADGKEVTTNVTYVNPNAADPAVALGMAALNSLSNNELLDLEKVSRTKLDLPQA